jgi:predicted DNA-binding protein YlxM (UPF0122 family)
MNDLSERDVLNVDQTFIRENVELCQTRPFLRKGGPYSKHERVKRRNEVFRLHFEHGYSSRNISEMLNTNRNTISGDINYWYSKLSKDWKNYDIDSWCMKQVYRLELQRTRLLQELKKQSNLQDKISLEKMILEIDVRLTQLVVKISTTQEATYSWGVDEINRWSKEQKLDVRFIHTRDITKVSTKTRDRIWTLINEDLKNRAGKS